MKKILLLSVFIILSLQAKTFNATYKISYGIFGELGEAKTTLMMHDNNQYTIKVHAYATGLASVLSSGKEEFYESHGIIKNNQLIPQKFIKISQNSYKKREKVYTFDHEKNRVKLSHKERRLITKHDTEFKPVHSWKESSSVSTNKYFAANDLLSLFFNLHSVIPSFDQGNHYQLKAIGANKTNGQLDINIPKGEKFKMLEETLETNNTKFIASINQKIFSSSKGELFISLNESGFCNKAILKDVLMFGDITGEMVDFKIEES